MSKKNKKTEQNKALAQAEYHKRTELIYRCFRDFESKQFSQLSHASFPSALTAFKNFLETCEDSSITIKAWIEFGLACLHHDVILTMHPDLEQPYFLLAREAFAKAKQLIAKNPQNPTAELNLRAIECGEAASHIAEIFRIPFSITDKYPIILQVDRTPENSFEKNNSIILKRIEEFAHKSASDKKFVSKQLEQYVSILDSFYHAEHLKKIIKWFDDAYAKNSANIDEQLVTQVLKRYYETAELYHHLFWEPMTKLFPLENKDQYLKSIESADSQLYQKMAKVNLKILSILTEINSPTDNKIRVKNTFRLMIEKILAHFVMIKSICSEFDAASNKVHQHKLSPEELNKFYQEISKEYERHQKYLKNNNKKPLSSQKINEINEKNDQTDATNSNKQSTDDQKENISVQDAAAKNFGKGNYFEAINAYQTLLPKNYEEIEKLDFEQNTILVAIADCFKASSLLQARLGNYWLSDELKNKAVKHYKKALSYFQNTKALNDNATEQLYQSFIKTSLENLKPIKTKTKTPEYYGSKRKQYYSRKNNLLSIKESKQEIQEEQQYDIPLGKQTQAVIDECKPHQVLITGGCVRDFLLGKHHCKDIDLVTTCALPALKTKFPHSKIIGKTSPVLQVKVSGELIDISPMRMNEFDEQNYVKLELANHATTKYTPTDLIEDDYLHRDFTMNALYYNPITKKITDPSGRGIDDINNKVIRTNIDPNESFEEDPIRMLRAVHFSIKLGFSIEPATKKAIIDNAFRLRALDPSRLFNEVKKLFINHGSQAFKLLNELQLLQTIFPKAVNSFAEEANSAHKIMIEQMLKTLDNFWLKKNYSKPALFLVVMNWGEIQEILDSNKFNPSNINLTRDLSIQTVINKIIDRSANQFNLTMDEQTSMHYLFTTAIQEICYPDEDHFQDYSNKMIADDFVELIRFANQQKENVLLPKTSMLASLPVLNKNMSSIEEFNSKIRWQSN